MKKASKKVAAVEIHRFEREVDGRKDRVTFARVSPRFGTMDSDAVGVITMPWAEIETRMAHITKGEAGFRKVG